MEGARSIFRGTQRSQAEVDRRAEEADRRSADFDRRLAELSAAADQRAVEANQRAVEADQRRAELAQLSAETKRGMQELQKVAANTSREVAKLTSRWGQFVENLVEPAIVRLLQERGIAVKETHRRIKVVRSTVAMEIDILAVDDDVAVVVEAKSRLSKIDVDEFLDKLAHFKEAFPRYADVQLNGAVAGIEIDQGIDRYAYRQGLFVIKQSGDTVEIVNDSAFRPTVW